MSFSASQVILPALTMYKVLQGCVLTGTGVAHLNCTLSIPREGSPNFPDFEEKLLKCRIC